MPNDELSFPTLLAIYRRRVDLSQTALADLIGIDHSYVSRLESGQREPDRDVLAVLAAVLDLGRVDRAALYLAAGYAPDDPKMRAVLRILVETAERKAVMAA